MTDLHKSSQKTLRLMAEGVRLDTAIASCAEVNSKPHRDRLRAYLIGLDFVAKQQDGYFAVTARGLKEIGL